MSRSSVPAGLLIASILLLAGATAGASMVVAQEQPYNNSSGTVSQDNWTDGREDVTLENVSHYVSRVSSFVIGNDPADAGVGAIFVGVIVGAISVSALGTSRAGLVASGTMSVLVVAALAAPLGAGFLPLWLFGVAVALIALIGGVLYIRMMR